MVNNEGNNGMGQQQEIGKKERGLERKREIKRERKRGGWKRERD